MLTFRQTLHWLQLFGFEPRNTIVNAAGSPIDRGSVLPLNNIPFKMFLMCLFSEDFGFSLGPCVISPERSCITIPNNLAFIKIFHLELRDTTVNASG